MATVNYSVPDDVKARFNEVFAGRNKSAIIARLMAEAIEAEELVEQRAAAVDQLLARRADRPTVTEDEVRRAREAGRP